MSEQNPQQAEKLPRPGVAALDDILGVPFKVLDDGLVRVVDYMGDDAAIVQAARVSYGAGTKATSDDRGLIRYLLRHRHTTPFEMCSLKLHIRVPMDAWRQWIRHRTASTNEVSTRYSVATEGTLKTAPDQWRLQSTDNKQGSLGWLDPEAGAEMTRKETEFHAVSRELYNDRLEAGIAREQARKDLPLGTYTEAYWKMDLHNLLHFLALRMDSHAQKEIRDYATIIGEEIVKRWVPLTWEAFQDYRLGSLHFSRVEAEIMAAVGAQDMDQASAIAREAGWLKIGKKGNLLRHRERLELESKLAGLNLTVNWTTES
ncbi:MAG: FAD-dependent thymidylate synthase [Candidatus Krumholzibacteria bacterium]|nr:FAD-dependent thymidylate synthase [Candidatus Krumholzibacteria bacterium]